MIRSMTGYGKAEAVIEGGRTIVEIRSVNHRYGEVSVKLPRPLLSLETDVRKCVSERLKRGKIDLSLQQDGVGGGGGAPTVNIPLAKAYFAALTQLKESLGLYDPVTLTMISAQKDVLVAGEAAATEAIPREEILAIVRAAVDALDAMREREGRALSDDLRGRRKTLAILISRVRDRAPAAVAENAARLKARVAQLAGESGVDEGRLAQEIAFLVDRCDITEELVRFDSHLQQYDETMELGEPIGRKLDFIIQELNREVNTIGSKANDAEITAAIVALKAELEKIREQVQNVE